MSASLALASASISCPKAYPRGRSPRRLARVEAPIERAEARCGWEVIRRRQGQRLLAPTAPLNEVGTEIPIVGHDSDGDECSLRLPFLQEPGEGRPEVVTLVIQTRRTSR